MRPMLDSARSMRELLMFPVDAPFVPALRCRRVLSNADGAQAAMTVRAGNDGDSNN